MEVSRSLLVPDEPQQSPGHAPEQSGLISPVQLRICLMIGASVLLPSPSG